MENMYVGKILDPIHGSISMTEIEKWIIQQKVFNRLRRVKQNTLLNYVFPGANHTRFEHSIGVMHLADQILIKSNENVTVARLKKNDLANKIFSIFQLVEDQGGNSNIMIQEVRLAALLHDVGHGPTSHKFDKFTIKGAKLIEILETDKDFDDYLERFKVFLNIVDKKGEIGLNKKIDHELVSCVFIIKLIKDLKKEVKLNSLSLNIVKEINLDNIIKMIEPEFDPGYEIQIGDKIVTDYFNSIISSFPIDADRMDYLYRDSFYSGVKYGIYDLSRILMSLIPVEVNNRVTMGIKSSGLDSAIRFIQSRNHLYNQVYFHKTNTSTNTMLDFIFTHLKGKSVMENVNTYEEFADFYWKNSDEYFFTVTLKERLQDGGCDVCGESCVENDVREELLERKLWKRIYEKKQIVDVEQFNNCRFDEGIADLIKQKLKDEGIFIEIYYGNNEGLKGAEKSKIVILDKEQKYKATKNWDTFNKELIFLNQTNVFITRIYLRKWLHEDDFEEASKKAINKFRDRGLI